MQEAFLLTFNQQESRRLLATDPDQVFSLVFQSGLGDGQRVHSPLHLQLTVLCGEDLHLVLEPACWKVRNIHFTGQGDQVTFEDLCFLEGDDYLDRCFCKMTIKCNNTFCDKRG